MEELVDVNLNHRLETELWDESLPVMVHYALKNGGENDGNMLFGIEIIDEIIRRNSSKLPEKMDMAQEGGFLSYLLYLSHMT